MTARRASLAHRALRGWLLALSSTGLAIAAHGLAGGGMPDTTVTIPVTVLIAWGAMAIADRLRGVVGLVCVLGSVQLGLHLLLTQVAGGHLGRAPAHPVPNGWLMLAGHALATLGTAVLLAGASSAITVVSSAVEWLLTRLLAPSLVPAGARAAITTPSTVPARPGELLEILLRRVLARRGPPVRS